MSFSLVVRFRTCDREFPVQIRAGTFFIFLLYFIKKNVICVSFLFLQSSSIKRQKAKEYIICYFRDDKIFVLVFHIVG